MIVTAQKREEDLQTIPLSVTALSSSQIEEADVQRPEDFIALPCSHPDCCAITYFVREDTGTYRSIPKLVGIERLKANLSVVGNRIAADDELWDALIGMMSETTTISRPSRL